MDFKNIKLKKALMILYDIIAVNLSFFIVALLAYKNIDNILRFALFERAVPVSIIFVVLYYAFGVYKSMWEYAGSKELLNLGLATGIGGIISISVDIIMSYLDLAQEGLENGTFSAQFYIFGTLLTLTMVCAMRIGYRAIRRTMRNFSERDKIERVMIVGAGDMGMIIIKELEAGNYSKGKPVVAVDDNPLKKGQMIRGVTVKGSCNEIPELAKKYKIDTIIICIPSATDERQAEILHIAVSTGCHLKTAPSLLEMVEEAGSGIRDVNITDLLSRPEVKLDSSVCGYVTDKTILVTGGGGSIGSELCRQISKYHPEKIIIFDIYENNAFVLKNQLDRFYNGTPAIIIRIGSVRDEERLTEVFEEFHPDVVFHAAAHKHVPLMEDNPGEAVKNNVFGTYNLASTAVKYGVERFVSISTDKAVNPTNVMGATKRVTEMIIQYFERKCSNSTLFTAVRFGNVLGSNGSVIPLFTEQIRNGGPVTVTHPDITRYFMTIPEASQLVVQAGGMAKGGEIFVLDMGEPVRILTLAENLIALSGYKPYVDIDIQFTGLRPGEKLFEELVLEEEFDKRTMTANNKIYVTSPVYFDDDIFASQIEKLRNADKSQVRDILKLIVPNFHEPEEAEISD